MKDEDLDWRRDIEIDRDRLDREWVRQPALFMRYAEAAVRARRAADTAKERLAVVRAEVDAEVRTVHAADPKKPTEGAIAAEVAQDDRVRDAEMENIDAWEQVGLLQAAREAMVQRKDALEALVRLYGQEYFSAPRASGPDARAAREELDRDANRERAKRVTRGHRAAPVGGR